MHTFYTVQYCECSHFKSFVRVGIWVSGCIFWTITWKHRSLISLWSNCKLMCFRRHLYKRTFHRPHHKHAQSVFGQQVLKCVICETLMRRTAAAPLAWSRSAVIFIGIEMSSGPERKTIIQQHIFPPTKQRRLCVLTPKLQQRIALLLSDLFRFFLLPGVAGYRCGDFTFLSECGELTNCTEVYFLQI